MTQSPSRLSFLDGLRGVAAVYVVLHHAMLSMPWTKYPIDLALRELLRFGHYAVDVFIVLSGYCLMLPVLKSGAPLHVRTFLLRRTLRIIPTYYAAMLLALALIATLIGAPTGTNWDASVPVNSWDIAAHVLLIHDWFASTFAKINYAFWSIGVEWKIYFLFPLMLALRSKYDALRVAVVSTLIGYALWALCCSLDVFNPNPWGSSPYYTGLFAMGMWAADLGAREARDPEAHARTMHRFSWGFGVLVMAWSLLISFYPDQQLLLIFGSGVMGAFSALLLVQLRAGRGAGWLTWLLTWQPTVWAGKRGYSIYLLHAPIVQLCLLYAIRPATWLGQWAAPAMLSLTLLVTLVSAHVFHLVAERPFHKLSQQVGKGAPAPAVQNR